VESALWGLLRREILFFMKRAICTIIALLLMTAARADEGERSAADIVRDALNHWRGLA